MNVTTLNAQTEQTTATSPFALTKYTLKALRTADSVSARRSPNSGNDFSSSSLECTKVLGRDCGPFKTDERPEARCSVFCRETVKSYDPDTVTAGTGYGKGPQAFAYSIGGSAEWRTIVGLLRVGDEIELNWVAAATTGYLKAAHGEYGDESCRIPFNGLYQDTLRLTVWRNDKRKYSFHVDERVCPNNSARMIRMDGTL